MVLSSLVLLAHTQNPSLLLSAHAHGGGLWFHQSPNDRLHVMRSLPFSSYNSQLVQHLAQVQRPRLCRNLRDPLSSGMPQRAADGNCMCRNPGPIIPPPLQQSRIFGESNSQSQPKPTRLKSRASRTSPSNHHNMQPPSHPLMITPSSLLHPPPFSPFKESSSPHRKQKMQIIRSGFLG